MMEQIYCIKCNLFRKFKNPKIYIFNKTFLVSNTCDKQGSNDENICKEEYTEMLKCI